MNQDNKGNKVAEWMQGSVKVEIYDGAYAGKKKEDIDRILKRISKIALEVAIAKEVDNLNV